MAARSEFGHRLRELKTFVTGKVVPLVVSRKGDGIDGFAKKLVAKSSPAAPDPSLAAELEHPDDVPEIVTGHHARRAQPDSSRTTGTGER